MTNEEFLELDIYARIERACEILKASKWIKAETAEGDVYYYPANIKSWDGEKFTQYITLANLINTLCIVDATEDSK